MAPRHKPSNRYDGTSAQITMGIKSATFHPQTPCWFCPQTDNWGKNDAKKVRNNHTKEMLDLASVRVLSRKKSDPVAPRRNVRWK
jgi:hypothetical protein